MADALLAEALAKNLTVTLTEAGPADAFERVPSELISKIISHFVTGESDRLLVVGARSPAESLHHRTLTALSLICKGMHRQSLSYIAKYSLHPLPLRARRNMQKGWPGPSKPIPTSAGSVTLGCS